MQSSLTHIPTGKWEFDEQVTDAFDDMLKRSIPQYDVMRSSVVNIAKNYAMQGASMIDLGCSKGEILQLLINEIGGYCKYIGVDISSAMLSSCRERFSHYPSELISIEECDLRTGVSVPLPGFSGLRLCGSEKFLLFLPVSVPLPGFSGLRHLASRSLSALSFRFQSRCRDSVG